MDIDKIRADLAALLADQSLFFEANLLARQEAVDFIKYAGDIVKVPGYAGALDPLYPQAVTLLDKLGEINETLFQRMRKSLQSGDFTPQGLRTTFDKFTDYAPGKNSAVEYYYDGLDMLLEAVLFQDTVPGESRDRTSGMIRYEPTPVRVILEMIDNLHFTPQDVFFDIGSGLGLVVILVNLLTGVRCVGVEFDPAYWAYARRCTEALNLKDVTFIQNDARNTDLNAGTIFYLFTPFVNEVFESVLERLRYTALRHPIYICAYGTITYDLIKLPWLQIRDPAMTHDFKLSIFTSK